MITDSTSFYAFAVLIDSATDAVVDETNPRGPFTSYNAAEYSAQHAFIKRSWRAKTDKRIEGWMITDSGEVVSKFVLRKARRRS